MQLEHSFSVPVGIDDAWRILIDIERIGPCMPGATIESVDGDDFTGSVKVKLGPINLTYKGKASFVEKDDSAHRAVIDARGRDARGNGTAAAKVTATLAESGGATTVQVTTDLDITGKPAQFGRGVMVDVGNKLIGQFADCLADTIRAGELRVAAVPDDAAGAAPSDAGEAPAPDTGASTEAGTEAGAEAGATPAAAPEAEPPGATEAGPAPSEPAAGAPSGGDVAGTDPAAAGSAAAPAPSSAAPGMTTRVAPAPAEPRREVEPINLLESAGPAVAKRLAPVAVAALVVLIAVSRYRRHR